MEKRSRCIAVTGAVLLHVGLLGGMWGAPKPTADSRSNSAPIEVRLLDASPVVPEGVAVMSTQTDGDPLARAPMSTSILASRRAEVSVPPQAKTDPYRSAAELDPPPVPLGEIEPEYPPTAGMQQGTVLLRLFIAVTGDVDRVEVVRADPPGVFDASAVAAFSKSKFSPGRYLGIAVRSQLTIAVDYTPINRGGAVSGQGGALGGNQRD